MEPMQSRRNYYFAMYQVRRFIPGAKISGILLVFTTGVLAFTYGVNRKGELCIATLNLFSLVLERLCVHNLRSDDPCRVADRPLRRSPKRTRRQTPSITLTRNPQRKVAHAGGLDCIVRRMSGRCAGRTLNNVLWRNWKRRGLRTYHRRYGGTPHPRG